MKLTMAILLTAVFSLTATSALAKKKKKRDPASAPAAAAAATAPTTANAAPAAAAPAKTSSGGGKAVSLDGKWEGYCAPVPVSSTSKTCRYEFKADKSGHFECQYFKGLRCEGAESKTVKLNFQYSIQTGGGGPPKITFRYQDPQSIVEEKSRFYTIGDVLRMQTYEVLYLPDAKNENVNDQALVPLYEYSRSK